MSDYEWKSSRPGLWERAIDDTEEYFHLVTKFAEPLGRQAWATTAVIRIDIEEPHCLEDRLREAWISLRYAHPAVACVIDGGKKVYEAVTGPDILDGWLDETFVVVAQPTTAHEYFLRLSQQVLKRPTLYAFPYSTEIALRCTHDWVDAEGAIRLLDGLLQRLCSSRESPFKSWNGSETTSLHSSQPLKVAAYLPDSTSEEHLWRVGGCLQEYASNLPSLGVPAKNLDQLPGDTLRYELSFPSGETADIVAAARQRGLTPTHVIHAACILASYRLSVGSDKERPYTSYGGIFGLRRFCTEPAKSDPMGLNVIVWPMIIRPPYTEFHEVARKVKDYYTSLRSDSNLTDLVTPLWQCIKPAIKPGSPMLKPATDPMILSLGVVDSLLKSEYSTGDGSAAVHVEEFWMAKNILAANFAIHLWTWKGCMTIGVAYNETYHEENDVRKFAQLVRDIVLDGLSVAPEQYFKAHKLHKYM